MKIHLLLLFTILFLKFGYTQEDYYPLVEEDKLWYVVNSSFGGNTYTLTYKCEGDTIIGEETYKVVFVTNEELLVNWTKYGYIREDENHKVYFSVFKSSNLSYFEPGLLYDFSASINDSLTITSFPYGDPYEIDIVITEIDSVLAGGTFRKRTWFMCEYYNNNFYIEGIGSENGLLEPGFYCTIICPSIELYCVKEQGVTIYPDGYTGNCFIVGIDELNFEKSAFEIYPNPATDHFIVIPYLHIQSQLLFELYNSLGKLVTQENLNNNRPTKIITKYLESGLYFYIITDENAGVQKGKIIIQ